MARRSDHSRDELREMAISAAESIVINEGYRSLNARRVASSIHYTVGTLYHLFKNFDELIMRVNGRTLDALYKTLVDRTSQEGGVMSLALAYLFFARQHTNRWKLLYEYRPSNPQERPDWYLVKLERLFGYVEKTLQGEGVIIPQPQQRIAATALWGSIHGICSLEMDERLKLSGAISADEVAKFMIARFMESYRIKSFVEDKSSVPDMPSTTQHG